MNYLTPYQQMIVHARDHGKTFVEIGQTARLSSQRVRDIYIKAKREIERHEGGVTDEYKGLSSRARNVMHMSGLRKCDVEKLVAEDKLRRLRNCGRSTQIEICRWAGVELPESLKAKRPLGWTDPEEILNVPQYLSDPMNYVPILLHVEGYATAQMGTCTRIGEGKSAELWWRINGSNSGHKVKAWMPLPKLSAK